MNNVPYVSFVVVGRNDNYGYKFMERFQKSLDNLTYLCEKYKLNSELIVVEWNPPKKNKRLYDSLKMRKNKDYLKIKFVEVSKKIHDSLDNGDKMPLFEYIGKNVGIRKASGKFVMITNPDIIFSEEMIAMISRKKLNENVFYRADRLDIDTDIPDNLKKSELIEYCKKNWSSCWSVKWGRYSRGIGLIKDLKRLFFRTSAKLLRRYSYLKYHGGGPGDFMLISRDGWNKFSGFPELKLHSGMDGYGCILAVASGYKFTYLKEKIYHQTHGRTVKDRPLYDMKEYVKDARKMLADKKTIHYNGRDWGLNKFKLQEKVF